MTLTAAQMMIIIFGFIIVFLIFFLGMIVIVKTNSKKLTTWCGMATCGHWFADPDSRHRCKISPILDDTGKCISYTDARCARQSPFDTLRTPWYEGYISRNPGGRHAGDGPPPSKFVFSKHGNSRVPVNIDPNSRSRHAGDGPPQNLGDPSMIRKSRNKKVI